MIDFQIFLNVVLVFCYCMCENVIDVDDFLSPDYMPTTLLMLENPTSNKSVGVPNVTGFEGSLDKAIVTMGYHRHMMNEYLCRNYIAEQIVQEMSTSKMNKRMGVISHGPGNTLQPAESKSTQNELLEDEGSSSYKDWLSKSTTLEDIYKHYDMGKRSDNAKEGEVKEDEEFDEQVIGYGYTYQPKPSQAPAKLGHSGEGIFVSGTGGGYPHPHQPSSGSGYFGGSSYGGHSGGGSYGGGGGHHPIVHEQVIHVPKHHHHVKYVDKKEGIAELLEIALTALAFLSFGMFIVHVVMCISMTTNTTTTAMGMMMPTNTGNPETPPAAGGGESLPGGEGTGMMDIGDNDMGGEPTGGGGVGGDDAEGGGGDMGEAGEGGGEGMAVDMGAGEMEGGDTGGEPEGGDDMGAGEPEGGDDMGGGDAGEGDTGGDDMGGGETEAGGEMGGGDDTDTGGEDAGGDEIGEGDMGGEDDMGGSDTGGDMGVDDMGMGNTGGDDIGQDEAGGDQPVEPEDGSEDGMSGGGENENGEGEIEEAGGGNGDGDIDIDSERIKDLFFLNGDFRNQILRKKILDRLGVMNSNEQRSMLLTKNGLYETKTEKGTGTATGGTGTGTGTGGGGTGGTATGGTATGGEETGGRIKEDDGITVETEEAVEVPVGPAFDGMGSYNNMQYRHKRDVATTKIVDPNNYALNELARRILVSIEAATMANIDNGVCLRKTLCENNRYSRQLVDTNKIWIPVWSLGMSWLTSRLGLNAQPSTSMLDSLKASILGLGKAKCEILYQNCDLNQRKRASRRMRKHKN